MSALVCQRDGCDNLLTGQRRKYCSGNCIKRVCDDKHRKRCPDCGNAMSERSGWATQGREYGLCGDCRSRVRSEARTERIEHVAALYNAGASIRQIAAALGYGENSKAPEIDEARRRGLIGYRNRGYPQVAA